MTETRRERASRLRDAALAIVKDRGAWEPVGDSKHLTAILGNLSIAHRTPFQKLFPTPSEYKYWGAVNGRRPVLNLPYGIDVLAGGKKVLNVEWDDNDTIEIVGFKRGAWEEELLKNTVSPGPGRPRDA